MSKYLIFIIFGILLYLLVNNNENFSIGCINIDHIEEYEDEELEEERKEMREKMEEMIPPALADTLDYGLIETLLSTNNCWEFSKLYRDFSKTDRDIYRALSLAVNLLEDDGTPTELNKKFNYCKSIVSKRPGDDQFPYTDDIDIHIFTKQENIGGIDITEKIYVPNIKYPNNKTKIYKLDDPPFLALPFFTKDSLINLNQDDGLSIPQNHAMNQFVVEYKCIRENGDRSYILDAEGGKHLFKMYRPLELDSYDPSEYNDIINNTEYTMYSDPLCIAIMLPELGGFGIVFGEIIGINREYIPRSSIDRDLVKFYTGFEAGGPDYSFTLQIYIDIQFIINNDHIQDRHYPPARGQPGYILQNAHGTKQDIKNFEGLPWTYLFYILNKSIIEY